MAMGVEEAEEVERAGEGEGEAAAAAGEEAVRPPAVEAGRCGGWDDSWRVARELGWPGALMGV